jgi:hypothetical protein
MAISQSSSPSHSAQTSAHTSEMLFSEAARSWLEVRDCPSIHARYLKPRTMKTYRLEIEALILFFGKMRLCDMPAISKRFPNSVLFPFDLREGVTSAHSTSAAQSRTPGPRAWRIHQRKEQQNVLFSGRVNQKVNKLPCCCLSATLKGERLACLISHKPCRFSNFEPCKWAVLRKSNRWDDAGSLAQAFGL